MWTPLALSLHRLLIISQSSLYLLSNRLSIVTSYLNSIVHWRSTQVLQRLLRNCKEDQAITSKVTPKHLDLNGSPNHFTLICDHQDSTESTEVFKVWTSNRRCSKDEQQMIWRSLLIVSSRYSSLKYSKFLSAPHTFNVPTLRLNWTFSFGSSLKRFNLKSSSFKSKMRVSFSTCKVVRWNWLKWSPNLETPKSTVNFG